MSSGEYLLLGAERESTFVVNYENVEENGSDDDEENEY